MLGGLELVRFHHTAKVPKTAHHPRKAKGAAGTTGPRKKASGTPAPKKTGDKRTRKRTEVKHEKATTYHHEHKKHEKAKREEPKRHEPPRTEHRKEPTRYGESHRAQHSHSGAKKAPHKAHAARRPHNGEPKY